MSKLKDLIAIVSIDGIGMSCYNNCAENVYAGDVLGEYNQFRKMNLNTHRPMNNSGSIDKRGLNYKWLLQYKHKDSDNILNIYAQKIRNQHFVPSVYAFFHSSYNKPLGSIDVNYALQDLCERKLKGFHFSKIHLATDLIVPDRINLLERISRSINPLKKRQIVVLEGFPNTLYLGSPISANQVVVYDKRVQLKEKKGILIEEDVSRIEVRMKMSPLKNRISTLDELRCEGWASFIYGNFFSLDRPRHALKGLIGKRETKMPLHKIKATMRRQNGKLPNNFHRDYIREHRIFGPAVRNALASYKWN